MKLKKIKKCCRKLKWNPHLARCFAAVAENGFKFTKKPNATLVTGDFHCAKVLFDTDEKLTSMNWDWIRFPKGELKRILEKERP